MSRWMRAFPLLLLLAFLSAVPLVLPQGVQTPVRYTVSSNMSLSLGILSPTFDPLPTPDFQNLTVIASNCTTVAATSCVPLAGATVLANVSSPDYNFTITFADRGDGNYTHLFLFYRPGNYTFTITANHSQVGSTSLVKVVSVNSTLIPHPNITFSENVTSVNGSLVSSMTFSPALNGTFQINFTRLGGVATFSFPLSFTVNITRSALLTEGGIFVSPRTAQLNISSVNGSQNVLIASLLENQTASASQEVFLFLNNTPFSLNLTLGLSARSLGMVGNESLVVSPVNASLSFLFYLQFFSFPDLNTYIFP